MLTSLFFSLRNMKHETIDDNVAIWTIGAWLFTLWEALQIKQMLIK